MIAGTPVLDIKPFIPDYDSPKTRTCMDLADCDTNKTETVSVESNISNICNDFDPPSNSRDKTTCFDNWECQLPQDGSEVENPLINPPDLLTNSAVPEDIHSALQEVKVYVKQLEMQQSHSQALDSPLSKALALSADRPSFGEEVYSTIAGWIREPPVGRLEVRFTPHAERELAGFLPATQPGKRAFQKRYVAAVLIQPQEGAIIKIMNIKVVIHHIKTRLFATQNTLKVYDPDSSSCAVTQRLLLQSQGCCQRIHGQSTGEHAVPTGSSSSPWTQQTLLVGLDRTLPRSCKSKQLISRLSTCEKHLRLTMCIENNGCVPHVNILCSFFI